jgi:uncharacterized protein (UPF0303 family)
MTIDEQITILETELVEIQLPRFDAGVAWKIGTFIHKQADAAGKQIACEVSRPGQQLFYFAMSEIAPDGEAWIRRKRNVVERFHKSSLLMRLLADKQGRPLLERYALSPSDYSASGGGVPIVVRGSGCVGTVTVSGLTQFEDHALGVQALREVLSTL